jgi:HlyD family secretion protein
MARYLQHSIMRPKSIWPLLLVIGACGLFTACSDQTPPAWSGYAEGDYVYIAAPLAGRLDVMAVKAGQNVAKGAPLFVLESEAENAARDEAAARLANAQAQSTNLDKGKRQDEIAVTEAQLAQAQASATLARQELQRQQQLITQGFVSKAHVDDATVTLNQAQARVTELQAALRVARLPARTDERSASQASTTAAAEVLRQSRWRAGQKQPVAPADALVAEVFFQIGEYIPAGQAVLSLLPPTNIKARFYVPETDLATISPGQAVSLYCDGCTNPIGAHISRIATQPEFTPPVIYSNAQRSKLVFLVEALPDPKDAVKLKPGQPLDVRRNASATKP